MDQLTETLLQSFYSQSNGFASEECCSSGPPSINFDQLTAPSSPEPNFVLGPYQQRRRLLSCIAENWPETDVYNSLSMDDHDAFDTDCFADNRLNVDEIKSFACETEDAADFITTLDESCILDIESLEDVSKISAPNRNSVILAANVQRPFSSASFVQSIEPNDRSLTKSCNGKLENVDQIDDDAQPNSINGICDDFIFLNPAFNQGKCRTPLPLISVHSSFYDEPVSLTDSIGKQTIVHVSQNTETSDRVVDNDNCTEGVDHVKMNEPHLEASNDQAQSNNANNGGKSTRSNESIITNFPANKRRQAEN